MLKTAKFVSLGVLCLVALVCGLVAPYFVYRLLSKRCQSGKFKSILGVLNCFSGGVFLSTTLLTMLPEAREAMEEVSTIEFPLTELLTVGGFLLILLIENVVHAIFRRRRLKNTKSQTYNVHQTQINTINGNGVINEAYQEGKAVVYSSGTDDVKVRTLPVKNLAKEDSSPQCMDDGGHVQGLSSIRDVVLMGALSIHTLFDGLGLGLMDEETKVWSVLIAISIHRVLIFFSTGLTICSNNSVLKFVCAMVYLTVMSTAGLAIGIAISSQGESVEVEILSAVLQGIAVGTFLYVAICEILTPEFENPLDKYRIHKVVSVCAGSGLLAVISYFV